jgi:ABC-type antimicrobial peptide transport system permease subunit
LARYFLTESLLLALAGGIVGIGLGYALMRWVHTLLPPSTAC